MWSVFYPLNVLIWQCEYCELLLTLLVKLYNCCVLGYILWLFLYYNEFEFLTLLLIVILDIKFD